ncbi:MAG: SDR family NAD(P)-dependent oxidoreductase [Rhizobiales bacterium]|nr:SDR family NAD(P)-dependent oxidoreductase [Hyphomicrobiales bacterium]
MSETATDGRHMLLTGAAGFIGFHVTERLLQAGWRVTGIDNINDYYSQDLKRARLDILKQHKHFTFFKGDIADQAFVEATYAAGSPDRVVHLAAQAGVRYSLAQPRAYIETNMNGFFNIMEASKQAGVDHFVFASSSSVYGANRNQPLSVARPADHPINLYAATKRSNELMAHAYSHLYGMPATALRFFTVYGPWGRPDMAYFKFTSALMAGEPIEVNNNGEMWRDFTYIDDITEGLMRVMDIMPETAAPEPGQDFPPDAGAAPFAIYNIGGNRPEKLMDMIGLLEKYSGRKADMIMRPMQPGEIEMTYADTDSLTAATGFRPQIRLEDGLKRFMDWYKSHYSV